MGLARLQRFGHSPIAIVGGGTGMIGDPSGKTVERQLLTREKVDENVAGIRRQLERILDFDRAENPARIVNNAEWLAALDLLGFLRDTGKYFTVNYMLQKESVNRRLESEEGISYTEFSYLLLQARDFLELFDRHHCTLQMGGTDQWGNITAGIDLVRKLRSARVHGLVWPLLTTAAGTKFGKTEAGTIWLDPGRTPPHEFYQFWLNADDRDVVQYLKYFTFLSRDDIERLEAETRSAPERRAAQRVLADEVQRLVHGDDTAGRTASSNTVLFGTRVDSASADVRAVVDDLLKIAADVPSTPMTAGEFMPDGVSIVELVARVFNASKSEARRLVESGAVRVNDRKIQDPAYRLTVDAALDGRVFLLQRGPRHRHLVLLT
jgi:tyrosyl-tRNA synthetase